MWNSRPPPIHGKIHLKFPFWLFDYLPKTDVLGVIVLLHWFVIVSVFSTFIMSSMIPDPDIFRLSPTLHVPSDGSDARAKLREGCLITGGAKEIYAPAHLVNKRIIISFSNVWQIFFATLPVDVWSASLHTLREYTKHHPKLSDSFRNPRALSSKIEFRTTQFPSTSSTGKRT